MRFFTMLIRDKRYLVPIVVYLAVSDKARAAEMAMERLAASNHHIAVELRDEDKPLACVERDGVNWFDEAI